MTNRFGLPRGEGGGNGNGQPPAPGDGDAFWDQEPEDITLSIKGVRARESDEAGWLEVELDTTRGLITLVMAAYEGGTGVAIFLAGAGGGDRGPANELYVRLGNELAGQGISAVRVKYREPGEFEECVADAMAALSFLKAVGAQKVVLVGHSFGGAVAVKTGELSPLSTAVCSMSTQRYGTFEVEELGKPLLLIHGSRDEVLDKAASEDVFERAREPKRIVILEGAGHGLTESEGEVFDLVKSFVTEHLATGEN
ncbi:MAG: alpha/beta hydrolase [Dehalococcoidia bacterium]|nr:alpha/beta hydrolase [Dehalococcoidia bacterium]MCA9850738.1 alpha/beta hydrolase [Dehalococcoidia bacterium]MCA9857939.1 alpha/beta hydrolase [Dehalococcoidia bacterium]MCB9482781.1 alpha/beta hydrolase [Dehalococcoidia bacterium]